ncbi:hypothetical protein [Streptomyces shenzhenensis]|nr:hypothetical protein [Streptomyces shenzhenensis]
MDAPALTSRITAILPAAVDHEVCYGALRQLIHAAEPAGAAGGSPR